MTQEVISGIKTPPLMMRFLPALPLILICYAGAMKLIPQKTSNEKHFAAASLLPEPLLRANDTYGEWKDGMEDAEQEMAKSATARAELETLSNKKAAADQIEKAITSAKKTSEKNAPLLTWVAKVRADETFSNLVKTSEELRKKSTFDASKIAQLPFAERLDKVAEYQAVQQLVDAHNQSVLEKSPYLKTLIATKPKIQPE